MSGSTSLGEGVPLGALPQADRASRATPRAPAGLGHSATIPSAWQFTFEAPAGSRVLRSRFIGVEAGFGDPETPCDDVMWWDRDNRRWIHYSVFPWGKRNPERTFSSSSMAPCRSFAAFKRHLRKHAHELGQRRVRLVSRFVGHDIVATPAPSLEALQSLASAIEARSDATGTGAAVGESAVGNAETPENPLPSGSQQ